MRIVLKEQQDDSKWILSKELIGFLDAVVSEVLDKKIAENDDLFKHIEYFSRRVSKEKEVEKELPTSGEVIERYNRLNNRETSGGFLVDILKDNGFANNDIYNMIYIILYMKRKFSLKLDVYNYFLEMLKNKDFIMSIKDVVVNLFGSGTRIDEAGDNISLKTMVDSLAAEFYELFKKYSKKSDFDLISKRYVGVSKPSVIKYDVDTVNINTNIYYGALLARLKSESFGGAGSVLLTRAMDLINLMIKKMGGKTININNLLEKFKKHNIIIMRYLNTSNKAYDKLEGYITSGENSLIKVVKFLLLLSEACDFFYNKILDAKDKGEDHPKMTRYI